MPVRSVLAIIVAAALAVPPLAASAQTLPGDHMIVPGVRIGAALLEQADQGALVRDLGNPDQTTERGDHEFYLYRETPPEVPPPPASEAGMSLPKPVPRAPLPAFELMIEFDLTKDAPFEISTASPFYRTRDGLGVGSTAAEVHAAMGAPLCEAGAAADAGLIVYGTVWFSTAQGNVTRVAIRKALSPADFATLPVHC
jgi:hypothetical protein